MSIYFKKYIGYCLVFFIGEWMSFRTSRYVGKNRLSTKCLFTRYTLFDFGEFLVN
ncbi:hypothetical protein HOH45_00250 [bacterium]|nr:hypothetical protein [bacterium]